MKLKVLVADDSKTSKIMIKEALNPHLYDIQEASNGQEALESYRAWKPDIILLDIMMPLVSGYAALKEIRQEEKSGKADKKTAVVMLTGLSDKQSIVDCVQTGIQGYVVKPFQPQEIVKRIEEAHTAVSASPRPKTSPAK